MASDLAFSALSWAEMQLPMLNESENGAGGGGEGKRVTSYKGRRGTQRGKGRRAGRERAGLAVRERQRGVLTMSTAALFVLTSSSEPVTASHVTCTLYH